MGTLLAGVEKITLLIGRCKIYEALYLKKMQFERDEWESAVQNLMSALVALYATMLCFLARAIRTYNQSVLGQTLGAMLDPREGIGFLEKCLILENEVEREVGNCDRIHNHRVQAGSGDQIQKLRKFLDDLREPILRIDSRVDDMCEKIKSSERRSILEWISTTPYAENHYFACQGRTRGTGEWLLGHERYREWRESSASMILWLHGDREYRSVLVE